MQNLAKTLKSLHKNGKIISRIAPTPSGYLHAGNALNFIITYVITKALDGVLHLRIDDYDAQRYRPKYVQNILNTLSWLELGYDSGARSVAEFEQRFSSRLRASEYERAIKALNAQSYACTCSKTTPNAYDANARYTGLCKNANKPHKKPFAIRLSVDKNAKINPNESFLGFSEQETLTQQERIPPAPEWAWDFVLATKDGRASYNLASLIDDSKLGVNLLVRGLDLRECSFAQCYLSRILGLSFSQSTFIYHPLLASSEGKKLSKSSKSPPLNLSQSPEPLYALAAKTLGLKADTPENMARAFKALLDSI